MPARLASPRGDHGTRKQAGIDRSGWMDVKTAAAAPTNR